MSWNNDYLINILSEQKMRDYRAEAENDRLARLVGGDYHPWWEKLMRGPATRRQRGVRDWFRHPQDHLRGPGTGHHHAAA